MALATTREAPPELILDVLAALLNCGHSESDSSVTIWASQVDEWSQRESTTQDDLAPKREDGPVDGANGIEEPAPLFFVRGDSIASPAHGLTQAPQIVRSLGDRR